MNITLFYWVIEEIGYRSCACAGTMHEVGVMVSYKCEIWDSTQLHLCKTYVLNGSETWSVMQAFFFLRFHIKQALTLSEAIELNVARGM